MCAPAIRPELQLAFVHYHTRFPPPSFDDDEGCWQCRMTAEVKSRPGKTGRG
jgi:hypothetical protein